MVQLYTCTMNLAIDLFIETETMEPSIVNRTLDDDIQANGKGVNVSLILKKLDIDSTAIGFSGGFTGRYIEEFLYEKKIATEFIHISENTRINVFTQVNQEQTEYKLVNKGPKIPSEKISELLRMIETIEAGAYLCVSGSLPQGISEMILVKISQIAHRNQVNLILDSSYNSVMDCLSYQPYLLKPNEEELARWFDQTEISLNESPEYLQRLIDQGAQRVLLSFGGKGCFYADKENLIYGNAPTGKVVNTACAGDTLLATFISGLLRGKRLDETLKHSIAAGSSTAFRKGLTDFSDIKELEKQIQIQTIEGKI
ncbi:1-phosphofructokinase [Enterococcus sp. 7E2_DIV0204]|uniref:Tagatose-6-phosphate kinase n=1 Tax=Candidatus Enterococcus lemimoniae TaxID=1834167 RepID=A0ABZ2T9S1_9ENTE|nr:MULTISPECIES: 1-phosphofructokinase [unclassified Enterococcus]OTN87781.1 1-phosphofructokinase [Enterococcus sp. 7E2_DIV0204]OTO69955.1 1-phosphofructokinase [Enterococcus sp. 12C11_DIV0727]OTP49537.1 1-phosphofructokinase [Enterococcus sp. 7D2_DIV0200]